MKTMFVVLAAVSATIAAVGRATAAESCVQKIRTEVVTKGTGYDGTRESETTDWTEFTAPSGYVIVEKEVKIEYSSKAGSENRVDVEYDNWVEVVPGTGIKQPTKIRVRSHARSPKHKRGARGWTKATVIVRMVKYQ